MKKENKNLTLKDAKKHFIKNQPLGHLTKADLKKKAEDEDFFVYGDKAQILQCFVQHEHMTKLFETCRCQKTRWKK